VSLVGLTKQLNARLNGDFERNYLSFVIARNSFARNVKRLLQDCVAFQKLEVNFIEGQLIFFENLV